MKIRSKNNFYYNNKILYSYQLSDKPFIGMMTKGNPISTSSVILKKSLINEKKFFSEEKDFLAIEDFDCWIKLSRKNIKFKMVNSVLGFYNMSNYSYSSYVNNKKNNYNLNKIYLKNLKFIKNHKIEKISKNHFRYLMANNCRNVRYKLLVYKSLLFKVTPKISKFKLILKILFFQFQKMIKICCVDEDGRYGGPQSRMIDVYKNINLKKYKYDFVIPNNVSKFKKN